MRKKISILLALTLFSTSIIFSQKITKEEKKEKERIRLLKIKSITEWKCVYDEFGKLDTLNTFTHTYGTKINLINFDQNGNMIEQVEYYADGETKNKYAYKYDPIGNMIEEIDYNSQGKIKRKYIYMYDQNGNRIEKSYGEIKKKYTFKYDRNGNTLEMLEYDFNDEIEYKYIYKYDRNGNMIVEVQYYPDGTIRDKSMNIYDRNGNKVGWVLYDTQDTSGRILCHDTYNYDRNGNKVEEVRYISDGKFDGKTTYKYDNNGNMIEEVNYSELDEPKYLIKYVYEYHK